jgi:hypothetical protein
VDLEPQGEALFSSAEWLENVVFTAGAAS